ncbi:MAG: hypothetical protein E7571_03200 [Ruminococcaceae bacterium]|nr:hypothetical protein [Oscillospiraceae bacterium]
MKISKDFSFSSVLDVIAHEKDIVYPTVFYVAGLLLGTFSLNIYRTNSSFLRILKSLFIIKSNDFSAIFINNLALYISVFAIAVLLGMCLIGYPVINAIPFLIGVSLSIKISYFISTFSVKGIGYSLIIIIPEGAAFVTVLILSISVSSKLSKHILDCTSGKQTSITKTDTKNLLKQYIKYALAVVLISFINSLLVYLLKAIITL